MTLTRLQGAQFKLVRAREHLDALDREITAYYAREPYGQRAEPNPPPGEFLIYAVVDEPPNPYWGTLAGDALHNIRSALNYVACGLVAANQAPVARQIQFPIHETKRRFDQRVSVELKGAASTPVAIVRDLQPYQVPNPKDHPLAIVQMLSNTDKHRFLPVAGFATRDVQAQVLASNPAVAEVLYANLDEIEHDSLLLHGRMTSLGPAERAQVNFRFRTLLMLDGRAWTGRLRDAHTYVQDEIVSRLQDHMP